MVRASLVLLLLALLLAVLLYFHLPSTSLLQSRTYLGIAACTGCHGTEASGDQIALWRRSAHARAALALEEDSVRPFLMIRSDGDTACLPCHAPLALVPADHRAAEADPREGVSCEICHGPGSDYATLATMRTLPLFARLGGKKGSLVDCAACHRPLGPEACPYQRDTFEVHRAWSLIAHEHPRPATGRAGH